MQKDLKSCLRERVESKFLFANLVEEGLGNKRFELNLKVVMFFYWSLTIGNDVLQQFFVACSSHIAVFVPFRIHPFRTLMICRSCQLGRNIYRIFNFMRFTEDFWN